MVLGICRDFFGCWCLVFFPVLAEDSADQSADAQTIPQGNNNQATTAVINNSNSNSLLIIGWLAEPC